MDWMPQTIREGLFTILIISGPLVILAAVLGLIIGVIQAATSINEMTLSFIPKLIALAMTLLVFGSWQLVTMVDFMRNIFQRIPALFG